MSPKEKGIIVLIDPSISLDALNALRELAEKVQKNELSVEQAKKEAEKIAEGAGKLFDVRSWNGQAKAALYASIVLMISSITVARIVRLQPSQTHVTVAPVVERVIEQPFPPDALERFLDEYNKKQQPKSRSRKAQRPKPQR